MSNDTSWVPSRPRVEAAWAATGALTVVLFGCGLLFGDLLGTTNYPALNASSFQLRQYFTRNVSEVRALSLFHLLAAAALAAFASRICTPRCERRACASSRARTRRRDHWRGVPGAVSALLPGARGTVGGR